MSQWQPAETAPAAMTVLACRFDDAFGEWIYGVVRSPPSCPFTHWMPLPEPPGAQPSKDDDAEVAEALSAIRMGLEFAYENGLHEFGYDPVKVIASRLANGPVKEIRGRDH